jgi:multiple sugar transport system ATP-binding protein
MDPIMASLTLSDIRKQFGRVVALSGIDAHVEDGELCVLLGPSGCGKSTLLNIIAGIVRQDQGVVLMDGRPVDHLAPKDRDVAMVFQNYALYPHMTVAQNLAFGLRMRGDSRIAIRSKITATARLLGIEELLDRKPRELSGGQRQRVAMGRALVRRPRLFLLDEPLSNLDARLRNSVRLELKQLHRRIKGTIVYVTHDQVEAMTLGDKVIVLRDGRIHQIGAPETIYERPVDTFVATFIGSPEMNLFSGRLALRHGRLVFLGEGFNLDLGDVRPKVNEGTVEIGLRPEDIHLTTPDRSAFSAAVEMESNIGSEKYLHGRIGPQDITIRIPKEADYGAGDLVHFTIDPGRVHIFREGRRLSD